MTADASSSARLPGRFRLPGLLALVLALLVLSAPGIVSKVPAGAAGTAPAAAAENGYDSISDAAEAEEAAKPAEAPQPDAPLEKDAPAPEKPADGAPQPPAAPGPHNAPPPAPKAQSPEAAKRPAPIRLFGTVEFRSPVKNLPKWERVRDSENKRPSFLANGMDSQNKTVSERWARLKEKLKDQPLKEQVQRVNNFFNQWPYKTDLEVWGVEDYWATPREFVLKSGDCEDYAISKYYALRDLGVPADRLRIAAVMDKIRGIGHAVGIVYMENEAYVLDNLTNLVLSHKKLRHYAPQYSVNEQYLWRHVRPKATGK